MPQSPRGLEPESVMLRGGETSQLEGITAKDKGSEELMAQNPAPLLRWVRPFAPAPPPLSCSVPR